MTLEVAVVTGVLTLIGTIVTVAFGNRSTRDKITTELSKHNAVQDERMAGINDRITALDEHVERHNKVIERTFRLEGKVEEIDRIVHAGQK